MLRVKALFGHPDAGGLRSLGGAFKESAAELRRSGGQEVIEFAGNFDFPENKLLLSTYVDDLNLAGPVDHHQKFWDKLTSLVDVELPEPIYRVLGRNHSILSICHGVALLLIAQRRVTQLARCNLPSLCHIWPLTCMTALCKQ